MIKISSYCFATNLTIWGNTFTLLPLFLHAMSVATWYQSQTLLEKSSNTEFFLVKQGVNDVILMSCGTIVLKTLQLVVQCKIFR